MAYPLAIFMIMALITPVAAAAQGNVLTIWENENVTTGQELAVPREDPARSYPAMREVERGRLESAIVKVQRAIEVAQRSPRREELLIFLEELERRLQLLNKNPNKYFALYPYSPPETK